MMTITKVISILILVGLPSPHQAFGGDNQAGSQQQAYLPRDYSMVSIETLRDGSGKATKVISVRVRLVKADGQWKQAVVSSSGRVMINWSKPDGVYTGEPGNYYLTRDFMKPPPVFHSVSFLRSHKQFVREGSLLGYRTFVLRLERGKGDYTEMHQAAEFGVLPIKVVTHLPDGRENLIEAVYLGFTEVTDKMLNDEGLLWIGNYTAKGVEEVEKQGRKELIEELRQIQKKLQARIKKK